MRVLRGAGLFLALRRMFDGMANERIIPILCLAQAKRALYEYYYLELSVGSLRK